MNKLSQEIQSIKIIKIRKNSSLFQNHFFNVVKMLAEKYKRCKIVVNS
jgi:hypothetical protein